MTQPEIYPEENPEEIRGTSGRWVILGIFVFAVCATGFEWMYLRMHRMPFIPLREAIAESFGRTAKVKIDGGRNKRGPMTLRVVIDVPFDPLDEADKSQAIETIARLEKLSRDNLQLNEYEFLQIYLVQIVPEGTPRRLEHRRPVADVLANKPIEVVYPATKSGGTGGGRSEVPSPAPLPELTK